MIQKMVLESNCMGYGPEPSPGAIVEQKLIIQENGNASLSSYCYGSGYPYKLVSTNEYHISEDLAEKNLCAVEKCFTEEYIEDFITDVGSWGLTISTENGTEKHFSGPLIRDDKIKKNMISYMIRDALQEWYIWVFDGKTDGSIW